MGQQIPGLAPLPPAGVLSCVIVKRAQFDAQIYCYVIRPNQPLYLRWNSIAYLNPTDSPVDGMAIDWDTDHVAIRLEVAASGIMNWTATLNGKIVSGVLDAIYGAPVGQTFTWCYAQGYGCIQVARSAAAASPFHGMYPGWTQQQISCLIFKDPGACSP